MPRRLSCCVCRRMPIDNVDIKKCARCHSRLYCGRECQETDWPRHKTSCGISRFWYDKHRKCEDGSRHEGKLELITWSNEEEGTGWGHCTVEEADDLRRSFETEYKGDEAKFFKYWPQGFRWTCCGTDGDMTFGCDHHGTGSKPCTCDYCKSGRSLPASIYFEKTASRQGLKLSRGPDLRSSGLGAQRPRFY
ncbi:hypothetical protein CVT26_013793 [Gymnopilus dilepis]|uniref:MYND-type domain-containing protein n=1 Tax=Gymnopilus dilepis TaxID=231916 RepID=A0A409VVT7_9AGAR|nr:hypothetical protein CVT26_013793 [Gymnopilus dilepis]